MKIFGKIDLLLWSVATANGIMLSSILLEIIIHGHILMSEPIVPVLLFEFVASILFTVMFAKRFLEEMR